MRARDLPETPFAYPGHPLEDHLAGTARIATEIVEKYKLDRVALHRLRVTLKMGGQEAELDTETMRTLFKTTALTHDIGKAATRYQRFLGGDGTPRRRVGFPLHEVPSAMVCYRSLLDRGVPKDISMLGATAVLMHMSAMRNPLNRGIYSELRKKFSNGWDFGPYRDIIAKFAGATAPTSIGVNEATTFMDRVMGFVRDQCRKFVKLYVLVLLPTLVGDNIDATNARGGGFPPWRAKLMEELLSFYEFISEVKADDRA